MARLIVCIVLSFTIASTCVYGQDDDPISSLSPTDNPTSSASSTDAPTSSASSTDSSEINTQSTPTITQEPVPSCPFPSKEMIYFPVEGDCSKFWQCYEGDAYLYTCPSDLWWNSEINQCDFPGAYCGNPLNFTCPFPSNISTFFAYPGNCNKFIECFEGTHSVADCPVGLWWNPEAESCDEPGNYCSDSTNSSRTSTTGSTSLGSCGSTEKTTTTTDSYTSSSESESSTSQTSSSTTQGTTTQYESRQRNVQTTTTIRTTTTTEKTNPTLTPKLVPSSSTIAAPSTTIILSTIPTNTAAAANPDDICPDTDDLLYFPYLDDCSKYWECLGGTKTLNDCAPGLWWNPSTSDCDAPGDYCTSP